MNTKYNDLLNRMSDIKDETVDGANTATRIGQMLVDFLDSAIIKGKDESGNPAVTTPNVWADFQSVFFQFCVDLTNAGYLSRNNITISETQAKMSSSLVKVGVPASTQGQLQEKLIQELLTPNKHEIMARAARFVAGELRKNETTVEIGKSEEGFFQVENYHKYQYDAGTTTYNVINKQSKFRLLIDALIFELSGSLCLRATSEGVFQNPSFSPNYLEAGWIAPYNHVKDAVVRVPYSSLISLDCEHRNSTMFYLDFLVGASVADIEISNIESGAEIIVFLKLKADSGGSLTFQGGIRSYFSIPALADVTTINGFDGRFSNTAPTSRMFKLNGKCLYNYPPEGGGGGGVSILWEASEFPLP